MKSLVVWLILALWCGLKVNGVTATTNNGGDPYKVLGVSQNASQDEIKKRYRKLCLMYHPDKNGNKPPGEREKCETMFKRIQKANSLIGTSEARQDYDRLASSPFYRPDASSQSGFAPAFSSSTSPPDFESLFREFASTGRGRPTMYRFQPGFGSIYLSGVKSIYVQKVKVKLEDLYTGAQGVEFNVNDSWWKRYRASFRGGSYLVSLYQALVYVLPLLRLGKYVALATGLTIFHKTLPRPGRKSYLVDLQPGYKGGKTKLTFRRSGEPEIIFELEEERHDRYRRIGNDLHTTITITPSQAKKGCTIHLDPLDEEEPIIEIVLQPNEIRESRNEVKVAGRGWPIRSRSDEPNGDDGQHMASGDLVVTVLVKKSTKQKHRKKS